MMDVATFLAIVVIGASFLVAVYLVVRFALGDALQDFEKWKGRK
jgi:hypothetical protein